MPSSHRVLAIGDIHGCCRAFDTLLRAIDLSADDLLITLGDYVGRGPDTLGVLNRLVRLSQSAHLVALRGNHEEMMMTARLSTDALQRWKNNGGDAALRSYSPGDDEGRLADVPDLHWKFIETFCVDYYQTATHFFVHAGARPNLDLADQTTLVLRWETFNDPPPHKSGKIMICGHTPQRSGLPRNIGHAICIDTAAHAGGYLTCLDVASGHFWQSDERGQVRELDLSR
jgi:serine/threonine protein phosphatase 1